MAAAPRFSQIKIETLLLAQKLEAALRAGEALLVADGIERPRLPEIVYALIVEAAATLRALPDRERTWLASCDRAGWPSIAQDESDASEAFGVMVERVRIGEEAVEAIQPRRARPTGEAIDRVWLVSDWRVYLKGRNRIRDWRILWMLATRVPVKKIAKAARCSPRTVYNVKDLQTLSIANGIREIIAEAAGE